ncbi:MULTISPECIES: IclR family transcriptional regulator [Actinomadura]|uniref:DNA-binding transcriptional regulator, IclR family n=1 Tax=Actinomadura madurae TaxID=1993 RepID=A0A1I5TUR6_9ACTN|nr:IclR family transcriptional regulator [Actinomadura madurae]SFP86651.1 DNA-binding transcriptional regulator, IclR family [Actinomadura madurae]SPT51595.1 YiaKLMNOPQRS operon repressor [Actinomadura madurae]
MTPDEDVDPKNLVISVLKACQLMECFTRERPTLTLTDLTAATGMNKTTVHRLAATLIRAGWLTRGDGATYRLTMRPFRVGAVALAELSLRDEAAPFLRRLADRFGDTAYLMIPGEEGAICVDMLQGNNPVSVNTVGVGTVLPYHAAAGPVVILAYSRELREHWLSTGLDQYTSHTVTDVPALTDRLEKVIRDGYAISEEDYLYGVGAVAAPVFDAQGDIAATLSLGGVNAGFRGSRLLEIIQEVTAGARDLSARLGH